MRSGGIRKELCQLSRALRARPPEPGRRVSEASAGGRGMLTIWRARTISAPAASRPIARSSCGSGSGPRLTEAFQGACVSVATVRPSSLSSTAATPGPTTTSMGQTPVVRPRSKVTNVIIDELEFLFLRKLSRCSLGHQRDVEATGREEAHEPRVVVEGSEQWDHEASPREEAACEGRDDGRRVPATVCAVREVKALQIELRLPHDPVVGDEHARDRSEAARITEEPREDVTLRIREEAPGLHRDADEARDEAARLEADVAGEQVREVVRGRHDVRGDIDGECRDDDREHRDRDDERVRELPDELDRIPDRLAEDDRARARDENAHGREREHRRGKRHDLAHDLLFLAPPEAREVGHVERQRGPEADHCRERRDEDGEELRERAELPGLSEEGPDALRLPDGPHEKDERDDEDVRRRPVLDLAEEVHAPVDHENVQAPEEQEREPLRRRVAREAGDEERRPAGEDRREERVEGLAADPRLDAEPAARDEGAHEGREVRAARPVSRAREDGERDAVFLSL